MLKKEFEEKAGSLEVTLNGKPLTAEAIEFSTKSVGWSYQNKTKVKCEDGSVFDCMVQVNVTVVNSKKLGKDDVIPGSDKGSKKPEKETETESSVGTNGVHA